MTRKRELTVQMERDPHRHAYKRLLTVYQMLLSQEKSHESDDERMRQQQIREPNANESTQEPPLCQSQK